MSLSPLVDAGVGPAARPVGDDGGIVGVGVCAGIGPNELMHWTVGDSTAVQVKPPWQISSAADAVSPSRRGTEQPSYGRQALKPRRGRAAPLSALCG